MVEAGKKAAITRASAVYTFEEHIEGKRDPLVDLCQSIREFILGLDESIEEVPKKHYIAYKVSQNIVCMEVKSQSIKLFLKLSPADIPKETLNYRDVSKIGHYGTGDVEFNISTEVEFEPIKIYIEKAYNKVGG